MNKSAGMVLVSVVVLIAGSSRVEAQSTIPNTQMVAVEGKGMRVAIAGLDRRSPGQPVLVLEAGAGAGLDNWEPIFARMAELAPVMAYDRRGIGKSDPDTVPQTLERVANSLHALLQETHVDPPYVLIGHSWGGAFTRKFASTFPREIAGLVYLDVTDFDDTRAELASLPRGAMEAIYDLPAILLQYNPPAGQRAEAESIASIINSEFAELRALRVPQSVPSVVVIAGVHDGGSLKTPKEAIDALVRLKIRHQTEWAFRSAKGVVMVSTTSRHFVHHDEPTLVIDAIDYVLRNVR